MPATGETVTVTIPGVRLKTPNNDGRGHWAVIARRTSDHRGLARLFLSMLPTEARAAVLAAPRLAVRVVRIGGRKMDTLNVAAAIKGLVDGIQDWTGVDDGDPWYEWLMPTQEAGKDYAVRLELTPLPAPTRAAGGG